MTKIIVDACCNHLGNTYLINKMIEEAAENGAWAIKFQLFNAEELNPQWPNYKESKDYYKRCMIHPYPEVDSIFKKCKELSILPAFTIFSSSVIMGLLEICEQNFYWPIIKIASSDFTNFKLIEKVLENFNKSEHIFISTGMASDNTIKQTMARIKLIRNDVKFLYCISKYPTPFEDINFGAMIDFDGFSDHTLGLLAAKHAIEMGIEYIEKHFTLSKNLPGKDHFLSIEPKELLELTGYNQYLANCINYKKRWVYA